MLESIIGSFLRFVGKVKKLETSVETMNSKCSSLEEQVREHQVLVQTWKAKNMTIEGEATVSYRFSSSSLL